MTLVLRGATDVGRVRRNNQDAYGIDAAHGLIVVADGMGGHAAGEVASRLAVDTVVAEVTRGLDSGKIPWEGEVPLHLTEWQRLLISSIRIANQMIFRSAQENPDQKGMGTTVVAALFHGGRVTVANVGDSRLYLWRGERLSQWTRDHSFVAEQVERGLLTPAEAATAANQNILTRALGTGAEVDVDTQERKVEGGDVFFLCTDGLTRMVPDADIAAALSGTADAAGLCDRLVKAAVERGGRDNVTVAAARVTGPQWWERWKNCWSQRRTRRQP